MLRRYITGVIHGDIKPQNILLFESNIQAGVVAKVGDFGSCDVNIVMIHHEGEQRHGHPLNTTVSAII